jgi:hypothetical protein
MALASPLGLFFALPDFMTAALGPAQEKLTGFFDSCMLPNVICWPF